MTVETVIAEIAATIAAEVDMIEAGAEAEDTILTQFPTITPQ